MDPTKGNVEIDPQTTSQQIEAFLRRKLEELGKQGIIIAISGGFDSALAAYLSVRALGSENVRLLNMPERDSKPIHRRHAQLVASELGIDLAVREITSILDEAGIYSLLPISAVPGRAIRDSIVRLGKSLLGLESGTSILEARFQPEPDSLLAKGKAYAMSKHRLRMLLLYEQAEIFNLMVVGAANRTEFETGTFVQWGCDQCADVMPLIHLYRSQLYPLARFLGIPSAILEKAADPDILPGLNDKEALLGSFSEVDGILFGLQNGVPREELNSRYGQVAVDQIASLVVRSRPIRESPYSIESSISS